MTQAEEDVKQPRVASLFDHGAWKLKEKGMKIGVL
jgi:hypothetical protein